MAAKGNFESAKEAKSTKRKQNVHSQRLDNTLYTKTLESASYNL